MLGLSAYATISSYFIGHNLRETYQLIQKWEYLVFNIQQKLIQVYLDLPSDVIIIYTEQNFPF